MQKPVIQRIKRRAEVCRSLPVTCGRRGNDTGNGLVTVVSLRCAVDCSLKNGKSPHSKPFTFSLPPSAKCRQSMFFTCCPAHLRHHHHAVTGGGNRDDLQVARAQKHTHHTDLCDTHPCKAGKRYGVIVRTARKAICAMNRHPCISDCTKSKKILKQGFYRENTRYKS